MTEYRDYLTALADLVRSSPQAADEARRGDEGLRTEVARIRAEARGAQDRNRRLRAEVDRQMEAARAALAEIGREAPPVLPAAEVVRATADDVTSALRALRRAVEELCDAVRGGSTVTDLDPPSRGRPPGRVRAVLALALLLGLVVLGVTTYWAGHS